MRTLKIERSPTQREDKDFDTLNAPPLLNGNLWPNLARRSSLYQACSSTGRLALVESTGGGQSLERTTATDCIGPNDRCLPLNAAYFGRCCEISRRALARDSRNFTETGR